MLQINYPLLPVSFLLCLLQQLAHGHLELMKKCKFLGGSFFHILRTLEGSHCCLLFSCSSSLRTQLFPPCLPLFVGFLSLCLLLHHHKMAATAPGIMASFKVRMRWGSQIQRANAPVLHQRNQRYFLQALNRSPLHLSDWNLVIQPLKELQRWQQKWVPRKWN